MQKKTPRLLVFQTQQAYKFHWCNIVLCKKEQKQDTIWLGGQKCSNLVHSKNIELKHKKLVRYVLSPGWKLPNSICLCLSDIPADPLPLPLLWHLRKSNQPLSPQKAMTVKIGKNRNVRIDSQSSTSFGELHFRMMSNQM